MLGEEEEKRLLEYMKRSCQQPGETEPCPETGGGELFFFKEVMMGCSFSRYRTVGVHGSRYSNYALVSQALSTASRASRSASLPKVSRPRSHIVILLENAQLPANLMLRFAVHML